MAKKRARDADGAAATLDNGKAPADESSDEEDDFDVVNVDFEWFNYDPEIDFHGVRTLLRQLFDVDSTLFDTSALTDLIIDQRTIGSTVKVDEKGNDAYAFLTVLSLKQHRDTKAVSDLVRYLGEKARTTDSLQPVAGLLSNEEAHVGLVLAERLINMPSEIAPPMYNMLLDEIEAAVEDQEPYEFSHYLILSKTYNEVQSDMDTEDQRKKKKARGGDAPLFYFHPEDEIFQKHAAASGGFQFTKDDESVADSKRAFQEMGVKSQGSLILIEAGKWAGAVKAVGDYLSPPT